MITIWTTAKNNRSLSLANSNTSNCFCCAAAPSDVLQPDSLNLFRYECSLFLLHRFPAQKRTEKTAKTCLKWFWMHPARLTGGVVKVYLLNCAKYITPTAAATTSPVKSLIYQQVNNCVRAKLKKTCSIPLGSIFLNTEGQIQAILNKKICVMVFCMITILQRVWESMNGRYTVHFQILILSCSSPHCVLWRHTEQWRALTLFDIRFFFLSIFLPLHTRFGSRFISAVSVWSTVSPQCDQFEFPLVRK